MSSPVSKTINVAVTGAAGRMGQRLIALARESGDFKIVAALERADHAAQGKDAGEIAGVGTLGLPMSSDLSAKPDLLIDFTVPASTRHWLSICRQRRIAMLVGTTGLQASDHALIDQAAAEIPILQSPTMALGVAVLFKIAGQVAAMLGDDYDIEIVESHHRFKKDAPSGTALGLADAILKTTGKSRDALIFDRHGDDCTRKRGEITMHALRTGDDVGCHTAYFGALGERLELTHRATNRDTFVRGALRAAKWLAGQKPGRYTLSDVLGI
jgi:4-hydroxy-tetrahydrodipicolinate reductase